MTPEDTLQEEPTTTESEPFDLEGLSDFERSVVEGFSAAAEVGEDDERAGLPSSPSPDDAPVDEPATTDAATDAAADDAAATTEDDDTIDFLGTKLTTAQARELSNLYEWASSLTPEQAQRVADALMEPAPATPAPTAPATTTTTTTTPATTPVAEMEFDDLTDPAVVNKLREMEAEIARLREASAAQESSSYAQRQAEANRVLGTVRTSYAEAHGLSEIEMDQLMARTYNSGITAHLIDRYDDPAELFTAAFDQTLWTDPTFREKEIARIQSAHDSETAAIQAQNRQKAKLAAGINSSSGSLPRQDPAPRDLSPADKHAAMVAELRAAQGG